MSLTSATPRVTVFIPVFNREEFIREAIESVLAQTFGDLEVLVVDDGSTDRSVEIVESIPDDRVRVECNGENLGIPRTRNRGLELARGEFLAVLDSDDLAHPRRLEAQVAFLDAHPGHAQVGGFCRFMDATGRPLKKVKRYPLASADIRAQLLFRCSMKNSTITGRTAAMRKIAYRNTFPRCQDYDLHVRLGREHALANLPLWLARTREHPGRFTGRTIKLGDEMKSRIISEQLDEMGVDYSPIDLEHHLRLSRMRKLDYTPDREHLEWIEEWLSTIRRANARSRIHPDAVLARVLCEKWSQACWAATRTAATTRDAATSGVPSVLSTCVRFVRSPLMRAAPARARQQISEMLAYHRAQLAWR